MIDYSFIYNNSNYPIFRNVKKYTQIIEKKNQKLFKLISKSESVEFLNNKKIKEIPLFELNKIKIDIFQNILNPTEHISSHKGVKKTNIMILTRKFKVDDWKKLINFLNQYQYPKYSEKISLDIKKFDDQYSIIEHLDMDDFDQLHRTLLDYFKETQKFEYILFYELFDFYLKIPYKTKEILKLIFYYYYKYKFILIEQYSGKDYFFLWKDKIKNVLDCKIILN
jgi:hypothetical protein